MTPFAEAEAWHRQRCRKRWEGNLLRPPRVWMGGGYHQRLRSAYRFVVPKQGRVLELGCGGGDLLASLQPAWGLGAELSFALAKSAKTRYPSLQIVVADAQHLPFKPHALDAILLSDLVGDLWDVQGALQEAARLAGPRTRLYANFYSRVWEPLLALAQALGLARHREAQSWITAEDMRHFLLLSGWEPMRHWTEALLPFPIPLLAGFANRVLVKLIPFRWLAMTNFMAARPRAASLEHMPSVSVIVPVRNEAGHVESIFGSFTHFNPGDEVLFVEGGSHDNTYEVVSQSLRERPDFPGRLLRQSGRGKADAVRAGFTEAKGDLLIILDGDLTVAAEMIPRFRDALRLGEAEFANGVRLVYPMEKEAMRPLNFLANKFFGLAFSFLLGQPVKDTLCGTKALWRSDYRRIEEGRAYFGDFDPFGDFDLLFGAAKLNLKISDIPVRYWARRYGAPNISRFRDGWLLLRMVFLAARRIKFV